MQCLEIDLNEGKCVHESNKSQSHIWEEKRRRIRKKKQDMKGKTSIIEIRVQSFRFPKYPLTIIITR